MKLKILAISFFLVRNDEFQPCFWLATSMVGLETVFFVFLGNEQIQKQIFRSKNYVAFVHLLKSTSTIGRFLHGLALKKT